MHLHTISNFFINEIIINKDDKYLNFSLKVNDYDYLELLFRLEDIDTLTKAMLTIDNFNYWLLNNERILLTPTSVGNMVLNTL